MYNNFSSKKTKKVISALLASALVVTSGPITADAATAKVVGVKKTITVSASATNKVTGLSKAEKNIVKVTKKGKKFTIKGLKAGKATFKIGKKSYTVKVGATTVKAAKTKLTLTKGKKATLKFTAKSGNGDTLTLKASNKNVTLAKKSAKIAKNVASVTATAKKAGKTTITATSKATGKKATVTVTVKGATAQTTKPAETATATAGTTNTPEVTATATAGTTTAPTTEPTKAPTDAPTTEPTKAPTDAPTTEPTKVPTAVPTASAIATSGALTIVTNVSGASVKVVSNGAVEASVAMGALENTATTGKLLPGTYKVEVSKKGYDTVTKEVTINGDQTVEVALAEETVLGASAAVTNSLIEYDNTVLVNDNAIVTVTVKDKDGKLVPGKTVVFSANRLVENTSDIVVKGQNVQTTDANGKASFVIGLKDTTSDSTDVSKVTSAEYTAKVLDITDGTNSTATGCVGFAALDLASVSIDKATIDAKKLDMGKNAKDAGYTTGIAGTKSLKNMAANKNDVYYISTQKVSSVGTDERNVTFDVNPQISLPQMSTTSTEVKDFIQPVNEKSGNYSTYAINEYDKVIVLKEDTSKLQYATLMFNSIQLSKYTEMTITSYSDEDCTVAHQVGDTVTLDGERDQKGFGYQIPLTSGSVKAIKVSIKSAGQVQTNKNAGYDIKEIVGVYNGSNNTTAAVTKAISSAKVAWEAVNPTMSNFMELTDAQKTALRITPAATGNTFDYQVPVYPNTGDAVIREFDSNHKVVAYYLAPTIKGVSDTENNKNTNIININAKAYKATEQEAVSHTVGTIKTTGNNVTVNSTEVGSTNLKGTVTLPSLGGDVLDASNKYVYTSVQWNPLPKDDEKATSDAFMALAGQNVTVYAQLTDKNGNPVTLSGQEITYSLNGTTSTLKSDAADKDINGTAIVKNTKTDVNGRATLVLNNAQAAVIDDLSAKASSGNYDVVLHIGNGKASTADIYWVNADLGFKKSVGATFDRTDNDTKTVTVDQPTVSTPWEYAVKTVGNVFVDNADAHTESYYKKFANPGVLEGYEITIDGLNIDTTFDEDNKGTYKVVKNGVVDATSTREFGDTVINALNDTSVGKDVTFTATKTVDGKTTTKTYACVGEGSANMTAKMKLNIGWKAAGSKIAMITPEGTTVSRNDADGASGLEGENGSGYYGHTDLYVRVTDETGKNPVADKTVNFKSGTSTDVFSNGLGATATSVTSAKTDANGIAHVVLNVANVDQKSSVITASVDGLGDVATTTINWVKKGNDFALVNAGVSAKNDKQVVLTFNNNVAASSVKKDMFEIIGTTGDRAGKKFEITDVTASGRYVTLTLKSALEADTYTVSVDSTKNDSITYKLADENGVAIKKDDHDTIQFYSAKTGSFDAAVSYAGDKATVKIDNIKSGIALTDLASPSNANIINEDDVKAYVAKYFVATVDGKVTTITASNIPQAIYTDIKDASFTFDVSQTKENQKVAVYFLGGSETYTVKAGDAMKQASPYTVDKVNKKVTLHFNRNIKAIIDDTNIKVTPKNASTPNTVTSASKSTNDVELTFSAALADGDKITIPAGAIEDILGYKNEAIEIVVDATAPTLNKSDIKLGTDEKTITVTFNEAMDKTAIENKSNWTFTDGTLGNATISGVTLSEDGKTATITLSAEVTAGATLEATTNLTDAHGNALAAGVTSDALK